MLLRLHAPGRPPVELAVVALVAIVALALARDAPQPSLSGGHAGSRAPAAAPPAA